MEERYRGRRPRQMPIRSDGTGSPIARVLHHQGEPHLRPGVRRRRSRQRRSEPGGIRPRRAAIISPRAVRAARQLLRPSSALGTRCLQAHPVCGSTNTATHATNQSDAASGLRRHYDQRRRGLACTWAARRQHDYARHGRGPHLQRLEERHPRVDIAAARSSSVARRSNPGYPAAETTPTALRRHLPERVRPVRRTTCPPGALAALRRSHGGTSPGPDTACDIADNDLALGRIVDA